MTSSSQLRVEMLGGFQVFVDGRAVADTAWKLSRVRALLKLLALAPGHQLHRELLMDTLWPQLDPAAAANNLHKVVHLARRGRLAPPALTPRPGCGSPTAPSRSSRRVG